MTKRKLGQTSEKLKFADTNISDKMPKLDEADGVRVGEEPLPGMRLRCICRGHRGTIGRIAWSPCGKYIASPSTDKTIRIWETETGTELQVLRGHTQRVVAVVWSPDGSHLASASDEHRIRIWNLTRNSRGQKLKRIHEWLVTSIAWSADGRFLVSGSWDNSIAIWDGNSGAFIKKLHGHDNHVTCVSWSHDGSMFSSVGYDKKLIIWRSGNWEIQNILEWREGSKEIYSVTWTHDDKALIVACADRSLKRIKINKVHVENDIEGHTGEVKSVACSADGKVYASKGSVNDNSIRLWRADTFELLAKLKESSTNSWRPGICFHPQLATLATLGDKETVVRIWDLDISVLFGLRPTSQTVRYTSAKIVLVGESNVGKSCLAMRLAEDRYPDEVEHGTTHGMRFWPMKAEELHPLARPPEGQRRDVVLWDFGGQDEYQLVHQMFLHDTTLAMVLIDPTRGRVAMDEARDWNKRLEKHLNGRRAVKLLVGAKQDEDSQLVNLDAIDELKYECGFAGYFETSAKTGRNISDFREALAKALDWKHLAKTSRPKLFQLIRDEIEQRRKDGEVVLLLDELKGTIKQANPELYEEAAVSAVAEQLAAYGLIAQTTLKGGEEALVLQVPVIERYAGSLVVAASKQNRGIAALEERCITSKDIYLPGMKSKNRLPRLKERIVIECVVQLMIQHGICFRHEGLYVFPSLFRTSESDVPGTFQHTVSLYYDFSGAVDNIYASLIAWLFMAKGFGSVRLWKDRAEFEVTDEGACGIRKVEKSGGFAHLDVYFEGTTPKKTQNLFVSFVEDHLRRSGIDVVERMAIKCKCGFEMPEEIVQERYKRGDKDVGCPRCDSRVGLTEGAAWAREHDSKLAKRTVALRTRVEKNKKKIAETVRSTFSKAIKNEFGSTEPIRILHLSDLHFSNGTDVNRKLRPLIDDLHDNDEGFGIERLDYLVVSGDATHQATAAQFEKARQFISFIIEEFEITGRRCIISPGNHDLSWDEDVYRWLPVRRVKVQQLPKDNLRQEGNGYLVRMDHNYSRRFQNFSDSFYHKLTHEPYPTDYTKQGICRSFKNDRLQFLTFNSCWQIDEFFPDRSGVHPGAVAHCLEEAEKQLKRNNIGIDSVLRVGVWHHPVTGNDKIIKTAFVEQLRKAKVYLALHGHVHEDRTDLIGYKYGRMMHVAGAGSFGVWEKERPATTPQLYNLIEINRDLRSIRVHTRYKEKEDGPWRGRAIWPGPSKHAKLTFYTVDFSKFA